MNERVIRDAWERFVTGGELPESLRAAVSNSWQRCKSFKVDVSSVCAPKLSDAELYRRRADNALLAASARLAMERAGQVLCEASSMLILTDGLGNIIETLGDGRTIDAGRRLHLEAGGCWAEDSIGTNAIGTALVAKQPIQIHAAEHFCERVQRWTCAAAPIFHPVDRELLGVIDISGPPPTFSSQNLALAVSLADHIENIINQSVKNEHSRLVARFQEKQRKWGSEDLVAIDRRGAIVCSSPEALRKLARTFGPHADSPDLSFLRSLPFDRWERDLSRHLSTTRLALVKEGEIELGAIVVLSGKQRDLSDRSSIRKRPIGIDAFEDVTEALGADLERFQVKPCGCRVPIGQDEGPRKSGLSPSGPSTAFVASDLRLRQVCSNVASAARIGLPVLIGGQTGTGKEELARYAHAASGRKGAFVPVNCSALPDSLIEAELFGYADGAFTGARRGGSPGLAKKAHGGTLFLDEIGDMPYTLQSVLLRFLDDHTVRPVGGTESKVDVFIVSATNVDLGQAVASKRFRADLLYRLNTVHVALPSLGERTDFEEIVLNLLGKIEPRASISNKAIAALAKRSWEGNVRQLKSHLARLVLAAKDRGFEIDESLLSLLPATAQQGGKPAGGTLREVQRARLLAVYAETGGNISETARRLNVCRNTVYRALENND